MLPLVTVTMHSGSASQPHGRRKNTHPLNKKRPGPLDPTMLPVQHKLLHPLQLAISPHKLLRLQQNWQRGKETWTREWERESKNESSLSWLLAPAKEKSYNNKIQSITLLQVRQKIVTPLTALSQTLCLDKPLQKPQALLVWSPKPLII